MFSSSEKRGRLLLIYAIFFVVALLTNVTAPLLPDIIQSFGLSLSLAASLPFAFFLAYGVMSIPAGVLCEHLGEQRVILYSFSLAIAAVIWMCVQPSYWSALSALFVVGLGMAAVQVAANPLLRVTGGEENFAFNAVLTQFVFGVASFASPRLYTFLASGEQLRSLGLPSPELSWLSVYWFIGVVALIVVGVTATVRFPSLKRTADERVGAWRVHRELLAEGPVWRFFLGIFCYVGLEQGLTNFISVYLNRVHNIDPQTLGAQTVSNFWGAMVVGCLLGLVLLKLFDSRRVLLSFSLVCALALIVALVGNAQMAVWGFTVCGFSMAVMWSIIFSLALNSVQRHHGTFSGILCTGIIGGAIVPLVIGMAGDWLGIERALWLLFLPLSYVGGVALWARPRISNKTLQGGVEYAQGAKA